MTIRLAGGAVLLLGILGCRNDASTLFRVPRTDVTISDETCDRPPNGCGPAGILGEIVPECPLPPACFIEACNEHDICYRQCNIRKSTCDNLFYLNMMAACAEAFEVGDPKHAQCSAVAYIYGEAVNRLGNEVFLVTQFLGCACGDGTAQTFSRIVDPGDVLSQMRPFEDQDDDMLPDDWERAVGLDPFDGADALIDSDADGVSNLMEFVHNADPFSQTTPP